MQGTSRPQLLLTAGHHPLQGGVLARLSKHRLLRGGSNEQPIERSRLGRIDRNRLLAEDFEATIASARALLYAASVMHRVRRLARSPRISWANGPLFGGGTRSDRRGPHRNGVTHVVYEPQVYEPQVYEPQVYEPQSDPKGGGRSQACDVAGLSPGAGVARGAAVAGQ